MTAPDPREIAAGLTKVQLRLLEYLSPKPKSLRLEQAMLVGYSLEKVGLVKRTWFTDKSYLTPLGQQVSAILKERDDG